MYWYVGKSSVDSIIMKTMIASQVWCDIPIIRVKIKSSILLFHYGWPAEQNTCSSEASINSETWICEPYHLSGSSVMDYSARLHSFTAFLKFSLISGHYSIVKVRKTWCLWITWVKFAVAMWVLCHLTGVLRSRVNDNDLRSLWSEPASCTYLPWLAAAKEWSIHWQLHDRVE